MFRLHGFLGPLKEKGNAFLYWPKNYSKIASINKSAGGVGANIFNRDRLRRKINHRRNNGRLARDKVF